MTESSGPTFSEAQATAARTAGSAGGGSWVVWAGIGFDNPGPSEISSAIQASPTGSSSFLGDCVSTPVAGIGSSISLPGFSGAASSGESPAWLVFLQNGSGGVMVSVLSGQGQLVARYSGADCSSALPATQAIGGGEVDSSVAASAALAAGGSAFLAAHPGATMTMAALGGFHLGNLSEAPTWTVRMTTCPTSGGARNGSNYLEFVAVVGMTSGRIEGSPSTSPTGCP